MYIESGMSSNNLILCCPLLLLPSSFSSFRAFPKELALHIRWPKCWSFSFTISPSNEHSGLISFRIDWFDLLAVQRTLKSLLQHHSLKASNLLFSAFFMVQLSHPYMIGRQTIAWLYCSHACTYIWLIHFAVWQKLIQHCKAILLQQNLIKKIKPPSGCEPHITASLSPTSEQNAGLDEAQAGIKTTGRNINNLRYTHDTTLMAENKELKSLLMKVKEKREKVNIKKTKIMASGPIISWQIDGETVETVREFTLGGSKITADGDCSHEIKRCLLLGRKAMINLDSILKSRDIILPKKVHLFKAMVFPVVMYGCENWTIKKVECWRTDAFKLWC